MQSLGVLLLSDDAVMAPLARAQGWTLGDYAIPQCTRQQGSSAHALIHTKHASISRQVTLLYGACCKPPQASRTGHRQTDKSDAWGTRDL